MKSTALCVALAALAAAPAAWSQSATSGMVAEAANYTVERSRSLREKGEAKDEARYRVCDAQREENPATQTIEFSASGRACLIDALEQAESVQGTLVLLRNASASLRTRSSDLFLRHAAMGAVMRARAQLADELPSLRERSVQDAAALDLAELSIRQPQLYYQQQQARLATFGRQNGQN